MLTAQAQSTSTWHMAAPILDGQQVSYAHGAGVGVGWDLGQGWGMDVDEQICNGGSCRDISCSTVGLRVGLGWGWGGVGVEGRCTPGEGCRYSGQFIVLQ